MIATEVDRAEEHADAEHESAFAWEWRVTAGAAVWVLPGVLTGLLARLCVGEGGPASWWMAGGAVLAATAGGPLEAGPVVG